MREAIGGTMLMYIVIFFLFVYIAFMAVVINYGRVFRVKNGLISYIENSEGISNVDGVKAKANELGYAGGRIEICYTNAGKNTYYSVRVWISFQMPLVDGTLEIPVAGETNGIRQPEGFLIAGEINPCGEESKWGNKGDHAI